MTGRPWEGQPRREEWVRWADQLRQADWPRPGESLRLSDAERDEAARALGEHFAEGRLTADEHGERSERLWAARTYADLGPLFRDLPGGTPIRPATGRAVPRPPSASRMVGGGVWWLAKLLLLGFVVVMVVTHVLPLLLIGLVVWWVLAISIGRWGRHRRRDVMRQRSAAHGWDRPWDRRWV
ncbi:MAG: DUF1707 domain-containing protein [Nocardioidaceae bacterium]|nr:DUF1707 domain-containing protein [Nocardioidaceae bacterium]